MYNPLKLAISYTVCMQSSPEWLNQTRFSLQRDFPCFYQPLWLRLHYKQDFNNGEVTIGVTTTTLKRKVLTFKSRVTMGERERVIGKISRKMFDILWLYCMWVTETGRKSNGNCCFIHLQIKQMATERRWELEREARERSESERIQMERRLLEKDTHTRTSVTQRAIVQLNCPKESQSALIEVGKGKTHNWKSVIFPTFMTL